MAYQYDEMGNVVGEYESEEERKKREELANTAVHTQEVKTYGDGTTERTTKEQLPATPTMTQVGAPVNPEIYQRMLQTESGNKDYTAGGQPMTSNKGALFASQVMPATAAAPGYGITPAAAQTPEEYNRVGQEYYAAMLKHFGGDERKAAAAYNAGPGAIQKNITANAGQMNEAQLPKETQGYLGKVFGAQPTAQAQAPQAAPVAPVAPTAQPAMQSAQPSMQIDDQGNKTITNPDGTTTVLGPDNKPLMAGGQVPVDTAQYKQRLFDEAGKDPFKWMQLSQDASQPPGVTAVAKEHARDLLQQQFQMDAAKEQVTKTIAAATSGDAKAGRAIADELKNQNGSWAKMILLGFLSPQLAGEEAVKLGFGNKWQSVTDDKGQTGLVQVNAQGLPLKGINADNTAMSSEDVAKFASGGVGALKAAQMPSVHGTPVVNAAGEGGMRMYDPRTRQAYVQVGNERRADKGWTTTGQAPGAVFNAAAAGTQGKAAGEGFTPGQVPGMPGVANTGTPGMVAPGQVAGPAVPGTAAVTGAMPMPAGAQPMQGAPVAPGAPVAGRPVGTIAQQKQGMEFQGEQQKQFSKYIAEDMQPKADAGAQISRIRKDQVNGPDGILNNPELAGLMQGTGGKSSEVANIVRDLITGNFKDQADLSQRVAALDLTPRQKDVLYKQIGLNAQINPLTLKANAGPGAVSEAEHKINAQANVDITRQPLYSGLSLMTRDQFEKDLQVARNDFRSARPDIATTDQMNRAWDAEKRRAQQAYDGIYAARAAYVSKYNPDGKTPGAVVDAFKHYPVPEWTGQSWDYKTEFARKAARPGLSSFNK
jgi:hypothetical protein